MNADPDDIVYIIESVHRTYDRNNRLVETTEVMDDDGWFSDHDAALGRCEQLNANLHRAHAADEQRQAREHNKKRQAALRANKEAAAIRAAGMRKKDVKVPDAYVPRDFETWRRAQESLTSYHVLPLTRSQHEARSATSAQGDGS